MRSVLLFELLEVELSSAVRTWLAHSQIGTHLALLLEVPRGPTDRGVRDALLQQRPQTQADPLSTALATWGVPLEASISSILERSVPGEVELSPRGSQRPPRLLEVSDLVERGLRTDLRRARGTLDEALGEGLDLLGLGLGLLGVLVPELLDELLVAVRLKAHGCMTG